MGTGSVTLAGSQVGVCSQKAGTPPSFQQPGADLKIGLDGRPAETEHPGQFPQ
jgi:hypothetical protein